MIENPSRQLSEIMLFNSMLNNNLTLKEALWAIRDGGAVKAIKEREDNV